MDVCKRERETERERQRERESDSDNTLSLSCMHTALGVFIAGVLISLVLVIPLAVRKHHIGMYIHSA